MAGYTEEVTKDMKVVITIEEVQKILSEHLKAKGYEIKPEDITPSIETVGQYEDIEKIVTGFEFNLLF
jgi:hypothetical protein